MIFHGEPKCLPNPGESQLLKCKVQDIFMVSVPYSTSHPFFHMTLKLLWFLVFKGRDLLHAQIYLYL